MPSAEAIRTARQVAVEMGYLKAKPADVATQAKASAAAILHKLPSKLLGNDRLQIFRDHALQLSAYAEHLDREETTKELNRIAATYIRDPAAVKDIIAQAVTVPIVTAKIKAEVKAKPQASPISKAKTGNAKPAAPRMNGTGGFPAIVHFRRTQIIRTSGAAIMPPMRRGGRPARPQRRA
jgi:hypothetical protein